MTSRKDSVRNHIYDILTLLISQVVCEAQVESMLVPLTIDYSELLIHTTFQEFIFNSIKIIGI